MSEELKSTEEPLDYEAMLAKIGETDPNEESYQISLVMLAGVCEGTVSRAILTRSTGLSIGLVARALRKLRQTGLIEGREWRVSNWSDPQNGGIAFCLDVAVAQGFLERVS